VISSCQTSHAGDIGINDVTQCWIWSFLSGQMQHVHRGHKKSTASDL